MLCDTCHEGICHVTHGKVLGGHLENTWHGDIPCGSHMAWSLAMCQVHGVSGNQ